MIQKMSKAILLSSSNNLLQEMKIKKVILPLVKNEKTIYNTDKGIVNGGNENVLQERMGHILPYSEQSRHDESNTNRSGRNKGNNNEQRRRSTTESNKRINANGKGQKHDIAESLGNDRKIIKYQESENNSDSFLVDKNAKRYEELPVANSINYNKRPMTV